MVDTMVLYYRFQYKKDYDEIYQRVDRFLKECKLESLHKNDRLDYHYTSRALSYYGFRKIDFFSLKAANKYHRYFVEIELQPIRLLQYNEHIDLSDFEQYGDIEKKFNIYIAQLFGFLNVLPTDLEFANWKVKRIDYAFQFQTPYVDTYIQLLHRGFIPRNYQKAPYDTNFYAISKHKRYNFYSKHSHLSTKKEISSEELQRAKDVIRFEVQCEKKAIEKIEKKFCLDDTSVKNLWDKNIAQDVIYRAIQSVIGEQDFYSTEVAREKLLQKDMNGSHLQLLRLIENSSNMEEPKGIYCKKHGRLEHPQNKFNELLRDIRELGINPITLPSDVKLSDSLAYLPNPCRHKFFDNCAETPIGKNCYKFAKRNV